MSKIYQLVKTISVPGGGHNKIIKTFSTRNKAIDWLEEKQYIKKDKKRWEKESEQDYFAWVYVEIRSSVLK